MAAGKTGAWLRAEAAKTVDAVVSDGRSLDAALAKRAKEARDETKRLRELRAKAKKAEEARLAKLREKARAEELKRLSELQREDLRIEQGLGLPGIPGELRPTARPRARASELYQVAIT